ncbi:MAG TPA: magnesium transporter [Actinomycetota bacterium]|jgi:mgtE-like transporter|nr:magnesium transporter [Actinomycetota bacterium]
MRRILAYWRAEQRTIGQGFVALLLASLGSLVAGIALGSITGTLEEFPGLMILLPAAIGMRGNIFGALGSRLGTSIHSGLFEPSLRREGVLYQNVYAATVLTLSISVVLGVLAKTFSVAFGVSSISLVDLVVISVLGGVISSLVVGAFTVLLSIQAHRHGWDMDSVSSPLVTAAGDVVTIPSLFVATFVVNIKAVTSVVAISTIILAVALTARGLVTDLPATRRVLRESLLLLAIAGTINLFAGLVVEARLDRFVTFPALLVLIPPFLGAAGALGGILSSRLASKLHLGVIVARGRPEALVLLDFTIIFLFAALTFALAGVSAHVASAIVGLASPGVLTVVGISMFAGLIATIAAVWVAYYSAVVTFRRGLDPDNFGIPLITSTLDFVGVIALIIALVTFGVA